MSLSKLITYFTIGMVLIVNPIAADAVNKANKAKQKAQKALNQKAQKLLNKEKKDRYKNVHKPFFKRGITKLRKELKETKAELKKQKQAYKDMRSVERRYFKAKQAAKSALSSQKSRLIAAQNKAELNPTKKNRKAANDMTKRYKNSELIYRNGIEADWLGEAGDLINAGLRYNSAKSSYDKKVTGLADVIGSKLAAKERARPSNIPARKNFEGNNQYGIIPKFRPVYDKVPPLEPDLGKRIYDKVPPLKGDTGNRIYDKVDASQMKKFRSNHIYERINDPLDG